MRKTDFSCPIISLRDLSNKSSVKPRSALSHREGGGLLLLAGGVVKVWGLRIF